MVLLTAIRNWACLREGTEQRVLQESFTNSTQDHLHDQTQCAVAREVGHHISAYTRPIAKQSTDSIRATVHVLYVAMALAATPSRG